MLINSTGFFSHSIEHLIKVRFIQLITIIALSNSKTLSTAVEELRDTVNEKIGEEKTAREEVALLIMMIMGVVKMMITIMFVTPTVVVALLEQLVAGDVESEERPGEAGEEEQGAEGENQGKAWSDPGTRRRQPGRRGRERIKSKAEKFLKSHKKDTKKRAKPTRRRGDNLA